MLKAALLAATLISGAAAAATIQVAAGADAQERLQTALIDAKTGDTVLLAAGRFVLPDGLSLDVPGVIVKGAGPDKTVLDFTSQKGEGEGLLITSNNVVVRDLAVENPKGNGIKSKGSDGISFVNLRVEWTGGPKSTNGAYGVYPVSSKNVLIDRRLCEGRVGRRHLCRPIAEHHRPQFQGRRQCGGHRDREQLQRRCLRQHRHRQHRRHPGVRSARPAAAGRPFGAAVQEQGDRQQPPELRRPRQHRRRRAAGHRRHGDGQPRCLGRRQ